MAVRSCDLQGMKSNQLELQELGKHVALIIAIINNKYGSPPSDSTTSLSETPYSEKIARDLLEYVSRPQVVAQP
jgi:hypothetical protein